MKYLESIRIVQFYLFEKEDIHLSKITGLFGLNASGKSALLDAVQVAVMGASKNYVALNAQADERASTRSLREYCLGQYGERPEQRARENAMTYITLLWRDSVTNEPTSMGVCISANADKEGHEVLGRYVLPGIELSIGDHLETVDDEERPRPWKTFRVQLIEHYKESGENPIYSDSERYIRAALLALRGSDRPPDFGAFTKAFKFGLRMRLDNKSVDDIVRNNVLEARPTDINKFKEITDSFRALKEMVAQVEDKITDGENVSAEFLKAVEESRRAVIFDAVLKTAKVEVAREAYNSAVNTREAAEHELQSIIDNSNNKAAEIVEANSEAQRYHAQREAHFAHKDYGTLQTEINNATNKEKEKVQELSSHLSLIEHTLITVSQDAALKEHSEELKAAADKVSSLVNGIKTLNKHAVEAGLLPAFHITASVSSALFRKGTEANSKLEDAQKALAELQAALSRIKEGHAPLDNSVDQLSIALRDKGINPIPVCDLVKITDPEWQPAIEAYLGPNLQALLVPAAAEADAFRIYRGLPRSLYGAKIVRESKQILDKYYAPKSVAALIDGENQTAVAYLRNQLGNIMQVTTDKEALADGNRHLTKDGMLISRNDFERLRQIRTSQLLIGSIGTSHRSAIQADIDKYSKKVKSLQEESQSLTKLVTAIGQISNKNMVMRYVLSTMSELQLASKELIDKTQLMKDAADEEYVHLGELEQSCIAKAKDLEGEQRRLIETKGRAEGTVETCRNEERLKKEQLEETSSDADKACSHPEYDNDEKNRHWEYFVAQNGFLYERMVAHFEKQFGNAKSLMEKAIQKGWGALGGFLQKHKEQAPLEINEDWLKAKDWVRDLLKRLNDTELVPHREEMERAYKTSQDTFRNDVAAALSDNLHWMDETLRRLNDVLIKSPTYSMGERYQFIRIVRPRYESLLKFVKAVAASGPEDDLFGRQVGDIPEEFRQLLEEKVDMRFDKTKNPLDDYREFYEFDIEILREDLASKKHSVVGHLSKRIGHGSGAEHRAPMYVIAGAALAAAYHLDRGNTDGPRLMLLDEAFNKMDANNAIAAMRYLEQLNLQVFLASPGEHMGALTAFLHSYYEIQRDPNNNTVMIEQYEVSPETRALFREDSYEFNPELIEKEMSAIRQRESSQGDGKAIIQ